MLILCVEPTCLQSCSHIHDDGLLPWTITCHTALQQSPHASAHNIIEQSKRQTTLNISNRLCGNIISCWIRLASATIGLHEPTSCYPLPKLKAAVKLYNCPTMSKNQVANPCGHCQLQPLHQARPLWGFSL